MNGYFQKNIGLSFVIISLSIGGLLCFSFHLVIFFLLSNLLKISLSTHLSTLSIFILSHLFLTLITYCILFRYYSTKDKIDFSKAKNIFYIFLVIPIILLIISLFLISSSISLGFILLFSLPYWILSLSTITFAVYLSKTIIDTGSRKFKITEYSVLIAEVILFGISLTAIFLLFLAIGKGLR